jgi:autotransporter-associated beta strand protein
MTASGTISLTGDVRFNVQAFASLQHLQVNSNILGSGRLIKDGAGALILNGDNSGWTGDLVASSGTVRITNPLAINNNVDIDIPTIGTIAGGTGNLMFEAGPGATISYGGNITGSGAVRAGGLGDPSGVVILSGNNTFDGSTSVTAGTLLINGTHPRSATVSATSGATLGGVGTVGDSEILARLDVQAGSILAPGATVNGIGTLTATGGATIAGTMNVGFSGTSIDRLTVGGALDITTGTVDFDAISSLASGARIFASYGSLVGATFATVTDLPAGFTIDYNYLGLNQIALVGGLQPGDFDGDGDVDGADFVAWQTNFPTSTGATLAQGDADGDGDVDGADFVVWQTNFPFTPGPGQSPVPEPSGIVLGLLSVLAIGAVVRRRK